MNPLTTIPKNQYVTLHGHYGERLRGMQMADGRFLVRDGNRVGAVCASVVAGWSGL